ncbi:protein COP1 SUPPRESSOR 2 isoform X2 [Andrographis paniculata]|nr:protein COP1 SUPPRESSOR 2 isoform X2 [Andrographis paniculata]
MPALPTPSPSAAAAAAAAGGASKPNSSGLARNINDKTDGGDVEKDDLVLQDTFAQETAVMVEDPNMLRYVEQELAKKRGRSVDVENQVENDVKHAEDELYKIPEHLRVKRRNSEENSTQWTTGIAEVQLPIEYKLKNIEETEAAKKLLQEKRFVGRAKPESSLPSSFSADFFQRGRDYTEKLKKENPPAAAVAKGVSDGGWEARYSDSVPPADAASRRQAATDEFMLERFRKRERQRLVRR